MHRTHRTLITTAMALAAALGASPAVSAETSPAKTWRQLCESRDGTFTTGFGLHRCFGAELDGRDEFTSAERVCDALGGATFTWSPTPDSYYGPDRGNWLCGPA